MSMSPGAILTRVRTQCGQCQKAHQPSCCPTRASRFMPIRQFRIPGRAGRGPGAAGRRLGTTGSPTGLPLGEIAAEAQRRRQRPCRRIAGGWWPAATDGRPCKSVDRRCRPKFPPSFPCESEGFGTVRGVCRVRRETGRGIAKTARVDPRSPPGPVLTPCNKSAWGTANMSVSASQHRNFTSPRTQAPRPALHASAKRRWRLSPGCRSLR